MSIEILVNVAPRETRAAITENGVVHEIYIERASRRRASLRFASLVARSSAGR